MYYLCENYDFMFDTFKENLPKALTLVNINITWEWEHQMVQCMNEYCDSLSTWDTQKVTVQQNVIYIGM